MLQEQNSYTVFPYESTECKETWTVHVCEESKLPKCSCHYFEFIGIPCSHIMAYLNNSRIHKIPDGLLLKRWTKGIKDGIKVQLYVDNGVDSKLDGYMELLRKANELLALVVGDKKKIDILVGWIDEIKVKLKSSDQVPDITTISSNRTPCDGRSSKRSITMFKKTVHKEPVDVMNPPRAKTKGSGRSGRPKLGAAKRLKSDFELIGKKPRTCKKCGLLNAGHDSRNCPLDSNTVDDHEDGIEDNEEDISEYSD